MSEAEDWIDAAWGLIANAYGGNWDDATSEWREAAERWRDWYTKPQQNAIKQSDRKVYDAEEVYEAHEEVQKSLSRLGSTHLPLVLLVDIRFAEDLNKAARESSMTVQDFCANLIQRGVEGKGEITARLHRDKFTRPPIEISEMNDLISAYKERATNH